MNYRNEKILRAMRKLPCANCGAEDGTVVAAHSNFSEHGKGGSIKAHDCFVAALCCRCHMELDQGKELTFDERKDMWERAHDKSLLEAWRRGLFVVDERAIK